VFTDDGNSAEIFGIKAHAGWGDDLEKQLPSIVDAIQRAVDIEAGDVVLPKRWMGENSARHP
jgi:hypothetical protein